MSDIERILMECRYLLSLNKSICELSKIFNVSELVIYDDLNNKLKYFDTTLFQRVSKYLKNNK